MKKYILLAILLPCFQVVSYTQIQLTIPDYVVENDEVFTVAIEATNFDSIISFQFGVSWDQEDLQLIGVENFGVPGLNTPDFGLSENQVIVSWFDDGLQPVSIEDSSTIFEIKFRAIATAQVITSVEFIPELMEGRPLTEFYNGASQEVQVETKDGSVNIGNLTSSQNTIAEAFGLDIQPNPLTTFTRIAITVDQPTPADMKIYDSTGKLLQSRSLYLKAGNNDMTILKNTFPKAGTYFVTIQTVDGTVTKQLQVF